MKITKGLEQTIPYLVIGALAIMSGPAMGKVLYRIIKKEARNRIKAGASRELHESAFRTVLTRLKKDGLVENPSRGVWRATKKALSIYNEVNRKAALYKKFTTEHGAKRDTIFIFDVPKKKGSLRHHLRAELNALGYEMLQKSVWIGGGPLPEDFITYLKQVDLLKSIHIFSIDKRGTVE